MGGEVADRQWNDILGVLKVQGTSLDMDYLQRWAAVLDVIDLLGHRSSNQAAFEAAIERAMT